ncbi:MAG TPA: hypothetical protein VFQ91_29025 [Bryobacteraceae bacterium]|nr:hypothetical protein [Bryobacteraceae bacterium]
MADGAQLRLPRLGYSENAQLAILFAAALASLFVNEMLGGGWWSLSMVITFPFITSGLSRLCTWRADQVPEHVVTCGDLARLTAALNAGALAAELGAPRDCELEELLHQVIHNYLGQEPKDLCAWNPPLSQLLDEQ